MPENKKSLQAEGLLRIESSEFWRNDLPVDDFESYEELVGVLDDVIKYYVIAIAF